MEEVELKFTCSEQQQSRLRASLSEETRERIVSDVKSFFEFAQFDITYLGKSRLIDTYYDTASRELLKRRDSCRLRARNGQATLTLKAYQSQADGQWIRTEYSREVNNDEANQFRARPQLSFLTTPFSLGTPLQHAVTIENDRDDFQLTRGAERYIMSIDSFTAIDPATGVATPPQLEVEIEAANDESKSRIGALRDYLMRVVKALRFSDGTKYGLAVQQLGLLKHGVGALSDRFVVLLVHGLTGNTSTWKHMAALIAGDPMLSQRCEVEYFDYPASVIRIPWRSATPLGIKDLSIALHGIIRVLHRERDIVLVGHSLGGLVVRQYILDHIDESSAFRIKRALLYAVPNEGAELARLAWRFFWGNRQLRQLCKDSDYLEALNDAWSSRNVLERIPVRYVIAGSDRIVDRHSAGRRLGVQRVDIIPDRNHRTVVRPRGHQDMSFGILKDFVLTDRAL